MRRLSLLNKWRGRSSPAFTLVEILVAVAIVVFLVLVLSQIISSAQVIWRNSEARIDAFRDARAALEMMSRDISRALINDRAPVLALSNVYSDPNDSSTGPSNNQQVYVLIPMQNSGDPGGAAPGGTPVRSDICAVGFYCVWDNNRHAYVLRKHVLQSNPTLTRLQTAFGAPTPAPPAFPSPAPTGPPVDPTLVYSPSNPATSPAEDEDIAAYVWDLKISPYENAAGTLTPNTTYPVIYRAVLPEFVEISFKAFSPQAARKLEAQNVGPQTWFDTTSVIYKNQILPNVQTFSTRIRLLNARTP
jgi:type II secretory pathway pseudopilin PulG